jgi:hypothetical protein
MQGIDTKEQQVVILTKPLDEATFVYIRKLLIGWQHALMVTHKVLREYYDNTTTLVPTKL